MAAPALEPPLLADVKKAESETTDGPALPDIPPTEDDAVIRYPCFSADGHLPG